MQPGVPSAIPQAPVDQQGVAGPIVPGMTPVPFVPTETTRSSWGRETEQISEREEEALAAQRNVDAADAAFLEQRAELAREQGEQAAALAEQKVADIQAQEQQRLQFVAQQQAALKQEEAKLRQVQERFANFKFQDYFADKTVGQKVATALAIYIGGLRSGIRGNDGVNKQQQRLDALIEQDYGRQKDQLALLAKGVEMQTGNSQRARQALEDGLNLLELKRAALERRLDAQSAALQARAGIPQAEIKLNQEKLDLARKAAEREQKVAERTAVKVKTGGGRESVVAGSSARPPTPGQTSAVANVATAAQDLQTLANDPKAVKGVLGKLSSNRAWSDAANKTAEGGLVGTAVSRGLKWVGVVPQSALDGLAPGEQKVANAMMNIEGWTRQAITGAGFGIKEGQELAATYVPQPGDGDAVIAQKLERIGRLRAGDASVVAGMPQEQAQRFVAEFQRAAGAAPAAFSGSSPGSAPADSPGTQQVGRFKVRVK